MTAKCKGAALFSSALGVALAAALVMVPLTAAGQASSGEQHGAELSKVVRLNRAPVNKEHLKVSLPTPYETTFPNGLSLVVIERHKLPTVAFSLWIKTGALADPKGQPGLASFTADMLSEGTKSRSSVQIATEVDSLGAMLHADAAFGASHSVVKASGLAPDSDKILDLMSDVVLNPTFPQDELDKYKQRRLADLEAERSQPNFLGREKFQQVLYRDFPAAVASPTADSIKAATSEDLRKFHAAYYVPSNVILGVVGDVTPGQIVEIIRKHFGDWKNQPVQAQDLPPLPPPAPSRIYLVDRPDSVQADLTAGDYAVTRSDPDFIPLTVTNRVLGGGPAARLFLNLREVHGYTYGAYSRFRAEIYRGGWAASTEVRNVVTDGSMHELMAELKRLRDEKVPDDELAEARRSIVASFALSLEQPNELLDRALTVKYYGLPADYWDRYPEEISRVSAEKVQETARKYLDLDHLQVVCVGDAKQPGNSEGQSIRQVLEKYGPVEIYDTNGRKLD